MKFMRLCSRVAEKTLAPYLQNQRPVKQSSMLLAQLCSQQAGIWGTAALLKERKRSISRGFLQPVAVGSLYCASENMRLSIDGFLRSITRFMGLGNHYGKTKNRTRF
jgi:hypothetical protein